MMHQVGKPKVFIWFLRRLEQIFLIRDMVSSAKEKENPAPNYPEFIFTVLLTAYVNVAANLFKELFF